MQFSKVRKGYMSDRKKEQAVERALTEGYEKYYRLAYSYVHNEADALDIVQEAAYKAILKSDSLKEPQYVETWFKKHSGAGSGSGGSLFDFLADSAYDSHHLICLRRQPFQNSAGAFSVSSLLRFHGDDAVADLVTDQNAVRIFLIEIRYHCLRICSLSQLLPDISVQMIDDHLRASRLPPCRLLCLLSRHCFNRALSCPCYFTIRCQPQCSIQNRHFLSVFTLNVMLLYIM